MGLGVSQQPSVVAVYHASLFELARKLSDIAARSPKDIQAFDTLADHVLERLDAADADRRQKKLVIAE